jgi:hypothetical protein
MVLRWIAQEALAGFPNQFTRILETRPTCAYANNLKAVLNSFAACAVAVALGFRADWDRPT